jgi:hypothetical protein
VEITLQSLLDELAREGGNLADLLRGYTDSGALTAERVAELQNEAREAFGLLMNAESRSAEDVAAMESLTLAVEALVAEETHIAEAIAAQEAQIAELAARAGLSNSETPAEGESTEGEDGDGEGENAEGEDGDGESLAETIANAEVVDTTNVPDDASSITETDSVAASGSRRTPARVNVASIARRSQRPAPETVTASGNGNDLPFGGSLVASAEAPGMRGGAVYNSWLDLGRVAANAFGSQSPAQLRSLAAGAERNGQVFSQRNGLAEFRLNFDEDLVANGNDDTEVLQRAADQSRLPGGSLLAAGGWCAPSETMYDLCDLPCSLDGILSLPEISAPRGGVRWTKGLDFCEIYNAPGFFHFTELEMEATTPPTKPCMEIPCVEFDECRLDVDGLCITGDIPQSRTYPEVIAQFLQGAMCAHAHRVNANKINQIVNHADTVNDGVINGGYGATGNLLYAIELEIQAYRYRGRRAQEGNPALLELVAPYWVKAIIRADIANRNGWDNPFNVTDEVIRNWFATRGVAIRFVYDWQDLVNCSAANPNGPITDYPNTVEFLLYEAGTWIVPTLDVITLENLYDSTLIRQNKFTALFTEQAFCVINRCNGTRRFQVPVCANGNTGAQVAVSCP